MPVIVTSFSQYESDNTDTSLSLCIIVVSGLDYFRVGMPDSLPYVGSGVRPDSYQLCADSSRHTVSASKVLSVKCNNTVTSRYVIVQSLDTTPERLCLAEVAVYPAGQYAVTFVLVRAAS